MTNTYKGSRRWQLMMSAALVGLCAATPSNAQDSNEETLEEVVVTGSRIRQNPLDAQNPVQVMSAEDIDASGQVSIADFLQRLPIAGSAINRSNNSSGNLGFPPDGSGIGAGASQVDLRYLSAKRVLVLVDGKRWIRGSSASGVSGAVDLNTIPVGIIKSVEVLQDGASTVYGSDAIAGVVNIITRTDYEGLTASAYYGMYDEGDGDSTEYDISYGASNDRSRVLVDMSYTKQGSVEARDREISAYAIPFENLGASSGTPQGRFVFANTAGDGSVLSITPNAGTGPVPSFNPMDPTGASSDYHGFTLQDRFNYSPYNKLLTPSERVNIFGKAEFDVTDTITVKTTAAYNNRRSVSQAAPEPLFIGPDAGAGYWMDNVVVPEDHPFNPFGQTLDGSNLIFAGRRPIEAGPRQFTQNVDTWYISNTVDGEFDVSGKKWFWDVTSIWSQSQANQVKEGAFNARKISEALGDPAACAALPGCTPLNYFGGEGTITPQMLDYIMFTQKDESRQKLFDFSANVSGELFELPAGPVGIAVGYEYRKETGSFTPDNVVSAGETAGVPASPTAGTIEVKEIYSEVSIPLVSDVSWAKSWTLSGAVRASEYNTSGSTTVFKIGTAWQANDDFTFRANWSEGFRAPNIGELYNTGSRFDSTITDPCDSVANATVHANCSTLGVPANSQQPNPQISVSTGGNRNLTPEKAETYTIGFTYSPTAMAESMGLESLTLEGNYYNISMTDAIQAPNASEVLNACVETMADVFCDAVNRSSSGTVLRIDGILTNIAAIDTDGMDWSISASTQMEDWGQVRVKWVNSHLFSFKESVPNAEGGVDVIERKGTELGSPERAYIKYKSSVFVDWTKDEWTVGLTGRYVDSFTEDCGGTLASFGFTQYCSEGADGNTISSRFYTDAQVIYKPQMMEEYGTTVTLGVQNLLDASTPICTTCDLNNMDGTVHAIPGRFFYARLSFKM